MAAAKIIEYKTANGDSWEALDKEVNKLLSQGFHLYGHPFSVEDASGRFQLGQALVKFAMHEKFPPADPLPPGSMIAP